MALYVGTDVGGTFTDLWVSDGSGDIRVFKSPTTGDVKSGVIDVLEIAAADRKMTFEEFCRDIVRFGHGTTVGLNALLTGRRPNLGTHDQGLWRHARNWAHATS